MVPDPEFIATAHWQQLSDLLTWLIVFVIFAIGFGLNFLLAHAVIPSLVGTGHLSGKVSRLRAPLYLISLTSLVIAGVFLSLSMSEYDVISSIFGDSWRWY